MSKLRNEGDKFPPRNLGGSEGWGRHVEVRVRGVEDSLDVLSKFLRNDNKSLTARAESLADQIKRVVAQQKLLEEQQTVMREQQEILEVQQRTLQSQQTQLTSVVAALPVTSARSGSESNFVIQNGATNFGAQQITVPDGKTKCSVFATGQCIFYAGNVAQSDIAAWRMRFARTNPSQSSLGTFGPVIPLNMDIKTSTFSHSADFSDLSPGSQITINAQSVAGQIHPSPYTENSVSYHVIITFYS